MIVRPWDRAPVTPPETGASTKRRPLPSTRAARAATWVGGQVDISRTIPPLDSDATAPASKSTIRAWPAFTTLSTSASAPAAA